MVSAAASFGVRGRICAVAMVLGAIGCGRTTLGAGHGAAGNAPLAVGSGGVGSGGVASGGRGGNGGGAGVSSLNDGGSAAAGLNSHGDCVLADTLPDAAAGTLSCKPSYDDELWCVSWMRTGPCGNYLVIEEAGGESMDRCFYDASTRRLVAEHDCTDVEGAYCGGRAACTWQGPDVGSCYSYGSLPAQVCPPPDAASVVRDAQTLPGGGDQAVPQADSRDGALDMGTEKPGTDACINAFPGKACADSDVPCPAPPCDDCAFWDCSDGQWVLKHACVYLCG